MNDTVDRDQIAATFRAVREELIARLESIEHAAGSGAVFERKAWTRSGGGGGEMGLLHGDVFEKAGVNFSLVEGEFSPEFAKSIPGAQEDPRFWASGVSVVIHPANPHVPAAHMNIRHLVTTERWFGGGADLTPVYPDDQETGAFHAALKAACDATDASYYPEFKAWCDRYFYLPHRDEPRGVGGIFFDRLRSGAIQVDFEFTTRVGRTFGRVYEQLVRAKMERSFTHEQRQDQLIKRGRYVEFNLLHDRGTLFGLKTGGNIEAILMSLPPMVSWP